MIKQSTPSSPKKKEPRKFLFLGPPAGGKTQTAMQFPSPLFLDVEGNLDPCVESLRKKGAEPSFAYDNLLIGDDEKPRELYSVFDALLTTLTKAKDMPEIKTIIVDNLTFVNNFIIQKIYKQQGVQAMEARHYDSLKSQFVVLFSKLMSCHSAGKIIICTCHEFIVTRPNAGDMMNPTVTGYEPAVQGKVTDYLGGFFTDVWRFDSGVKAGNKRGFTIEAVKTTMSDLKNSLEMPPKIEIAEGELAWTKLEPYLRGNI